MSKFSTGKALAIAIAASSSLCAPALADQTHVTVTVAAGASSKLIALPIANSPIVMSCTQTLGGNVGTGQATITRSATDGYPVWTGYDASGFTHGFDVAHIIYCDNALAVDIEMASATEILVKNPTSYTNTVTIMFTY